MGRPIGMERRLDEVQSEAAEGNEAGAGESGSLPRRGAELEEDLGSLAPLDLIHRMREPTLGCLSAVHGRGVFHPDTEGGERKGGSSAQGQTEVLGWSVLARAGDSSLSAPLHSQRRCLAPIPRVVSLLAFAPLLGGKERPVKPSTRTTRRQSVSPRTSIRVISNRSTTPHGKQQRAPPTSHHHICVHF